MRKRIIFLLLLAITFSFRCGRSTNRTNVLLITIDTLRSDHCSIYGYSRLTSPVIDRVSHEGARVQIAYAPLPQTGPSHATIFTGRYPISHGIVRNGQTLDQKEMTMAEILKEQGYQTAAVVSAFCVDSKFQLDQGFDTYDDEFEANRNKPGTTYEWAGHTVQGEFSRRAAESTEKAISWLEKTRSNSKPFFLWIHYFDPHGPYDAPEPYRGKFIQSVSSTELNEKIAAYDGEISYVDEYLGRFLNRLSEKGLSQNTILIVTADHGEGLMEHGRWDHGHFVYEEDLRIPLIFRWPEHIQKNQVLSGPVELTDVLPTVLDLLEIKIDSRKVQGHSLEASLKDNKKTDPNRPVFFQRRYGSKRPDQYGVRTGNYKYLELQQKDGATELYDLQNDPDEKINIITDRKEDVNRLSGLLLEWKKKYQSYRGPQAVSDEDAEKLRALGYTND